MSARKNRVRFMQGQSRQVGSTGSKKRMQRQKWKSGIRKRSEDRIRKLAT